MFTTIWRKNCIWYSFVHKAKDKVEIEEKTIETKGKNEGLVIHCDNTKPKKSLPNLDLTEKGTKLHKCSICDYTTLHNRHLKKHIESVHEGKKPNKCSICDLTVFQTMERWKNTLKQFMKGRNYTNV